MGVTSVEMEGIQKKAIYFLCNRGTSSRRENWQIHIGSSIVFLFLTCIWSIGQELQPSRPMVDWRS